MTRGFALAPPGAHDWQASLSAAVPRFASDLLGLGDGSFSLASIGIGVAAKMLLLAGVACVAPVPRFRDPGEQSGHLIRLWGFAGAALLTCFLSLALAYYQLAALCCLRHAGFRESLIVLALAAAGAALSNRTTMMQTAIDREAAGAALFIAAIAVGLLPRAADIAHDYAIRAVVARTIAANWRSGRDHGNAEMNYVNPPANRVADNFRVAPGSYRREENIPWDALAMLLFFDKAKLTVEDAPPMTYRVGRGGVWR